MMTKLSNFFSLYMLLIYITTRNCIVQSSYRCCIQKKCNAQPIDTAVGKVSHLGNMGNIFRQSIYH